MHLQYPDLYSTLPGESKKVSAFGGISNEKYMANIQTKMLIYQSQAKLDVKISFSKITHFYDLQGLGKLLHAGCMGTRNPRSFLVHYLLSIEIKVISLKRTMLLH